MWLWCLEKKNNYHNNKNNWKKYLFEDIIYLNGSPILEGISPSVSDK